MNQGNSGKYKKDNGVYQDGGLVFQYPNGKWQAFFFAFQSQTFDTDDQGNPRAAAAGAQGKPQAAQPTSKSKSKAAKKGKKKTS